LRALTVRRSVAELKQLVEKPEVVEAWDVTAQDPRLLVHLKGTLFFKSFHTQSSHTLFKALATLCLFLAIGATSASELAHSGC
jgi:hypothetical protein